MEITQVTKLSIEQINYIDGAIVFDDNLLYIVAMNPYISGLVTYRIINDIIKIEYIKYDGLDIKEAMVKFILNHYVDSGIIWLCDDSQQKCILIDNPSYSYHMQYHGENVESALKLRNYQSGDYDNYFDVCNQCFYQMRQALNLELAYFTDPQVMMDNQLNIFILEIDNNFIGSVSIYDNEIDDLFVAPSYRSQGYGRQLLQFAINKLQKHGCQQIILRVAAINHDAVALYLAHNFSIEKSQRIGA